MYFCQMPETQQRPEGQIVRQRWDLPSTTLLRRTADHWSTKSGLPDCCQLCYIQRQVWEMGICMKKQAFGARVIHCADTILYIIIFPCPHRLSLSHGSSNDISCFTAVGRHGKAASHIPHPDKSVHDDAIKCKHFLRYWPFVRGIHRSPVNSPHEGQWRGALMFSLIFTHHWSNGWVNNRDVGDLRCHRTQYDVTVMSSVLIWTWTTQYLITKWCNVVINDD